MCMELFGSGVKDMHPHKLNDHYMPLVFRLMRHTIILVRFCVNAHIYGVEVQN